MRRTATLALLAALGCGTPAAPIDAGMRDAARDPPRARDAGAPDAPAPTDARPQIGRGACQSGACWVHPGTIGSRILAISGSPSLVVAVGEAGAIVTWDGHELRAEESPHHVDLLDVYAEEPGRIVAVGAEGVVIERSGSEWLARDCGTTVRLEAIHGAPGGPLIAAGERGTLIDVHGHDCPRIRTSVTGTFHDVHVLGARWFVVAADRVITFEDRRPVTTWMASDRELRSVAAIDAEHVFVAGRRGWLALDGSRWRWNEHTRARRGSSRSARPAPGASSPPPGASSPTIAASPRTCRPGSRPDRARSGAPRAVRGGSRRTGGSRSHEEEHRRAHPRASSSRGARRSGACPAERDHSRDR